MQIKQISNTVNLPCLAGLDRETVPYCTLLYLAVPCCTLLYLTVPCCTLLYLTAPCCTLLYFSANRSSIYPRRAIFYSAWCDR